MSGTVENSARGAAKKAGRVARDGANSEKLEVLGRAGVAAIGVVHLLLAWLALQIAFGGSSGGQSADQSGALQELAGNPAGKVLLALLAIGFLAYAGWQAAEAAVGFGSETEDRKRLAKRVAAGAKAVVGLALAAQSIKSLIGAAHSSSSQNQSEWTAKLLSVPAGKVLVVLVGLAVIGGAGYLAYQGWAEKFLEKLKGQPRNAVVQLGRAGFIARGVVYGILGVLVVIAGVKHQPDRARGLDAALKSLAAQPFGTWLLAVVALGLAAFGVFNVITAKDHREG